tara:strand:- start:1075 stop:1410 length:336 start_codon:yes stop_codon:yes gene_type:complete
MKLYATISSERAKKSQGGNEQLEIEVRGEDKKVFLELTIIPTDNQYLIRGYAIQPESEPNRRSEQYIAYEITKSQKAKNGDTCQAQVKDDLCNNQVYKNDYCKKHFEMFDS